MITGPLVFLIVAAIGGVAQVIDGSLGMGFGVFSSSMLIASGFAPAVAVAVVNAAKILTGLASGVAHWRFGNVNSRWLLPMVLGGVAGGFLGAYLLTSVPPETARPWVSGFLLLMGLVIVLRSLRRRTACINEMCDEECTHHPESNWQKVAEPTKDHTVAKMGVLGFVAALSNGLTGAYGPIATSGVLLLKKGEPRYAVGTVNLAEFFVASTVASTILLRQGLGDFPGMLVLALAIGGIVAAPLAAYVCRHLPSRGMTFLVGSALIAHNLMVVVRVVR